MVELLAAAQLANGHSVQVLASTGPGGAQHPFVESLRRRHIPVTPIELPSRAYRAERAELRRLISSLGADVVHTHGYRSDVVAGPVARSLGVPTVSTAHGLTMGSLRNRFYEWLQFRTWRRLDAVVAVSRPLRERLHRQGLTDQRLFWIPNAWQGDSAPVARDAARSALGLPADGLVVGWVGRLSQEKGPDVLIEALARMTTPGVRVALVGSGPEVETTRALAQRLGVTERVHWLGMITEAGKYYRAFDCFALSSRTEGTPMALFEAMAAETPVVATTVGGVPDVVSPVEARLVPPQDPAALAQAIDAVLGDAQAASLMARRAIERLRQDFSVTSWVAAYDDVYRSAARRMEAGR